MQKIKLDTTFTILPKSHIPQDVWETIADRADIISPKGYLIFDTSKVKDCLNIEDLNESARIKLENFVKELDTTFLVII